jgi:sugar lactone lactonase YvrE
MKHIVTLFVLACCCAPASAQQKDAPKEPAKPPFAYAWGTAYHILPGTHTDESGYFSLCEGKNGKVYVGTAAYGLNAYLIEFDPKTGKQRIVVDVNKVCGLTTPTTPTYAAQSKIHTRNHVAPSGKIYVGSKQGYRRGKDDTADYPGGYVVVYDPEKDTSENFGIPFKGEGVNDVTADEKAGLAYVVTCEDHHWMILDLKTKKYREPDANLRLTPYAQTLIDNAGRAVVITRDFKLARFDPATNKLEVVSLASSGKAVGAADDKLGPACWAITPDAKTAYLVRMSDSTLFRIDLTANGPMVPVTDLGRMIEGKGFDSRGSLIVGTDGKVHAIYRVDNTTKFGAGYLHHLVTHDPATKKMTDRGVLAVKNADWFDFGPGKDGKPKPWSHGFHKLPDGTYTPLHAHMALAQARDGTFYATIIYPFTLLRIEAK